MFFDVDSLGLKLSQPLRFHSPLPYLSLGFSSLCVAGIIKRAPYHLCLGWLTGEGVKFNKTTEN